MPQPQPDPAVSLPIDTTKPRKWSIFHESGPVFADDDDHSGIVLIIELSGPEAAATATHLMSAIGQPEGLDNELAEAISWKGSH